MAARGEGGAEAKRRIRLFRSGLAETARVAAFSDGVLAIVITLLVLDIREPHVDLPPGDHAQWVALGGTISAILAWVLSFGFVLYAWIAHHYLFDRLTRVDRGVLWLNGLFLLTISFAPFPTAFMANHWGTGPATLFFSAAMLINSLTFTLLRWYVSYGARLFDPSVPQDYIRRAMRRALIGPAVYGAGTALAMFSPLGAIGIELTLPIIFFVPLPGDEEATDYSTRK